MRPCIHKTANDHSETVWGAVGHDGKQKGYRMWRCSRCPVVDRWSEGWAYFGDLECRKCQTATMETVTCPACSRKVADIVTGKARMVRQ